MAVTPTNLVCILSDEHSRDSCGAYGHPLNPTPNIDRLAASGTRFERAYTNCPICIPARASLATGSYVHQIGYWDNAQPYDGKIASWQHRLRSQGYRIDSVGKLHFRGAPGDDHGFTQEIDPLHVVESKGDVLGCIRENPPRRHKRSGIEEAGPGDSSYIRYDTSNGDKACAWIAEHSRDTRPWALFVGFVLPHPPYVAPPEFYSRYALEDIPMPPQWQKDQWPKHPTLDTLRSRFDFEEPFEEEVIKRVNAAYLGACTHMDRQVGRIIHTLEEQGLLENSRIIYTSDHGEDKGARGLFGKFTMYEESVGVPLIMSGPEIARGKVVGTPVSLVDIYPTVLETVGAEDPDGASLPGSSLFEIANNPDHDRIVFSEYHAVGSRRGYAMVVGQRYKLVSYVEGADQLFDLKDDPKETNSLIDSPAHGEIRRRLEVELRGIVEPESADRRAREDQAKVVDREGGRERVIARGAFDNSPVPGEKAQFH